MSISWPLERDKDRRARASMSLAGQLRLQIAEWFILIITSISVAIAASCISVSTAWLGSFREGYCHSQWFHSRRICTEWRSWPSWIGWLVYILLSIVLAFIPAYLVKHIAPGASMSGIPELRSIFQGFENSRALESSSLLVKVLGLSLVSASGLWLGQEAPLVHISAITCYLMAQILPISKARQRDLMLASTAVGISVAFSSPVGGVMFAIEAFSPSRGVTWKCFVCSILSIGVLRAFVSPSSGIGGLVLPETGLFRVHYDRVWQQIELIPFIFLGAMGGLYGALVPKLANLTNKYFEHRQLIAVLCLSTVTAVLSYFSKISRIPSIDLVSQLFSECTNGLENTLLCKERNVMGLIYTLMLGIVLAPGSFTLAVPSGILFPGITIGALGGRLVGLAMQASLEKLPAILSTSFCPDASQHCITPGVYALVGAASFLTGITRLTISSVILMLEMTGALTFIVPIMTGVIVAKWVNDSLGDTCTVYTSWQSSKKWPSLPDSTEVIPDLYASEIMIPKSECVYVTDSVALGSLDTPHMSVPLLGPNDEFRDLLVVQTGHSEPYIILPTRASLKLVLSSVSKIGLRTVIFCKNNIFQGMITRDDLVEIIRTTPITDHAYTADDFELNDTFEVESI